MKIQSLSITNFRGIREAEFSDLRDLVVIAGANGSGKSSVFDAIRMIKSVYGGYSQNEIGNFFSEFNIDLRREPMSILRLANDRKSPIKISMKVALDEREKQYLRDNLETLVATSIWETRAGTGWLTNVAVRQSLAAQQREYSSDIEARVSEQTKEAKSALGEKSYIAEFVVRPNAWFDVKPSKILELSFGNYLPGSLGLIDYHGPHRIYAREVVNQINVNLSSIEDKVRNAALYNYISKYSNIKSEMAGAYVREMISKRASNGSGVPEVPQLIDTLKEMFDVFFPDKSFVGPLPMSDGSLEFPVRIGDTQHDLDDLSAGEKEILYGYLRLRNSAPRYSIILLDEPELHLNPKLVRSLPAFYYKHLAAGLKNQVWLVTHSDALIRDAVGDANYSLFHMSPSLSTKATTNQVRAITGSDKLQRAVIDLVDDLAGYQPGAPLVIFESESSEFDVFMVTELFPEFARRVNAVAGTNKDRVRGLYSVMAGLSDAGKLPFGVFAITDADLEVGSKNLGGAQPFNWDAYHIENYLLDASFILSAAQDFLGPRERRGRAEIEGELKQCARESIDALVEHRVRSWINKELTRALDLRVNKRADDLAAAFDSAVRGSRARFDKAVVQEATPEKIRQKIRELRTGYRSSLKTGSWRSQIRGRDVLSLFVGRQPFRSIGYEHFRNAIVARMRDAGHKPPGMRRVLAQIETKLQRSQ